MKAFTEIQSDLTTICQLFNLGELKSHETKNHSLNGYKIAKFETTNGNYQYIFKN
jgi:hypothetical protein